MFDTVKFFLLLSLDLLILRLTGVYSFIIDFISTTPIEQSGNYFIEAITL